MRSDLSAHTTTFLPRGRAIGDPPGARSQKFFNTIQTKTTRHQQQQRKHLRHLRQLAIAVAGSLEQLSAAADGELAGPFVRLARDRPLVPRTVLGRPGAPRVLQICFPNRRSAQHQEHISIGVYPREALKHGAKALLKECMTSSVWGRRRGNLPRQPGSLAKRWRSVRTHHAIKCSS